MSDVGELELPGSSDSPEAGGHDRTRLTLLLVVVAFVVVVASCAGGVAGVKRLYGRPPGPEIGSPELVEARAEAARVSAAAVAAVAPAGSAPVATARQSACFLGSREIFRWDRFSWRCASRTLAVRTVPAASLQTAMRDELAQLTTAGWHKEYDYFNQSLTDRVSRGTLSGDVSAAGYSLDGTLVEVGFGRPVPEFAASCIRFSDVDLESTTAPYWVQRGPVLHSEPLTAAGADSLLLTVAAQRTWFSR